MVLLDPKLDVVFKLLFADPKNERLLTSLIEAVLRPPLPIASLTVLDREVRKEQVEERGIFLDVLVALDDGTRINIEMQCDLRGAVPDRWLYGWARLFSSGIDRGEADADDGAPLVRWARFLRARDTRELDSLAREDPVMADAKQALERLSQDEEAHYLAEARLKGKVYLAAVKREVREEGREEGRREERETLCREMANELLSLLSSHGVEVSGDHEARIRACSDPKTLFRWVARASTIEQVSELFTD